MGSNKTGQETMRYLDETAGKEWDTLDNKLPLSGKTAEFDETKVIDYDGMYSINDNECDDNECDNDKCDDDRMILNIHQQKQLSLQRNNARIRPMRPLLPSRLSVLGVSCLASGPSQRPFLLPQAPCALVTAQSVPPPSATFPLCLRHPAYPYQIGRIGCRPHRTPTSSGLDPSAGIPERFIHSLPHTAIL